MERVERIKREGSSELLMHLTCIARYQQMCESIMKKATEKYLSLFNRDDVYWYYEGIVVASSVLMELNRERVIEVGIQAKQLLRVNGEEVKGIEHAQVLDLSDDGERWEGEYTYRSILTNDNDSSTRDIVEFYNKRGGKERIFDDVSC